MVARSVRDAEVVGSNPTAPNELFMAKKSIAEDKYFTFIIVPHNSARGMISFRVRKIVLYSLLFISLISIIIVSSSTVYTGMLTRRLLHYKLTLSVNEEQKRQIDYFTVETSQVKEAIRELLGRDNELRRLLGLQLKESKINLAGIVTSKEREKLSLIDSATASKIGKIKKDLIDVEEKLKERKESLEALQKAVAYIRARFAATPSIWPVYGRIVSGFGYRYYPWRGFHTGLDITGWYGEPVRAPADGIVTEAGWNGGYGKSVMIDHGYGLVTLYGHNSKLAVGIGQRIKKGQIIAYVGSSGLATGPHVHYEIRRGGRVINPYAYLNLNIFTASRIWNK